MGLIYVNPEGPNGKPDPIAAARDIRETFGRMAMNDEETVALIAGGHTFGKAHGAGDPNKYVGPEPEGAALEEQGFGWKNTLGTGNGADTITSGLEGAWTTNPTKWDNNYFENLFGYEWELTKSPGRCAPVDSEEWCGQPAPFPMRTIPKSGMPHDVHHRPRAEDGPGLRADLPALLRESAGVCGRIRQGVVQADASRHGADPPLPGAAGSHRAQLWQDPLPAVDHELIDAAGHRGLEGQEVLASGLSISQLVSTAWASASTFRGSDKRGGANGARIRLAPQKDWEVNQPAELAKVLGKLEKIQKDFNGSQSTGKKVSLADLIVLGGCAAVEEAAKKAGHNVKVPFSPGRTDASQEQTDAHSFAVMEPTVDGFRNYLRLGHRSTAEELLVDRAQLLRSDSSRNDRAHWRHARAEYRLRPLQPWRLHQATRDIDQ